jgi:hypothetical protein
VDVLNGDSDETLPDRVELDLATLSRLVGASGRPLVDAERMIPGSLVAGERVPVGVSAAGAAGPERLLRDALSAKALYGVNFELDDGDLVAEPGTTPMDVRLVSGARNLDQGLDITIRTIRGSNQTFPGLGIDAPIGEENTGGDLVPARVCQAILEDDRVRSVTPVLTQTDGAKILTEVKVFAWGSDLDVVYEGGR